MKKRTLLMIPGPIEFEPAVLSAMGDPTTSHLAPSFIEAFGGSQEQLRQVFNSPSGQPLVLAGSGTLAMDCAGANLLLSRPDSGGLQIGRSQTPEVPQVLAPAL